MCTWKIGGFSGRKHTPQSRASVSSTVTSPAAAAPSGGIRDGGGGGGWEDPEPFFVSWTPALARAVVALFRTATPSSRHGNSRTRNDSPARSLTMTPWLVDGSALCSGAKQANRVGLKNKNKNFFEKNKNRNEHVDNVKHTYVYTVPVFHGPKFMRIHGLMAYILWDAIFIRTSHITLFLSTISLYINHRTKIP